MKFACRCGNILRDQLIPNPVGFRLISDVDLDTLEEPMSYEDVFQLSSRAIRCDRCGRLWVAWKGRGGEFEEYAHFDVDGKLLETPPAGEQPKS